MPRALPSGASTSVGGGGVSFRLRHFELCYCHGQPGYRGMAWPHMGEPSYSAVAIRILANEPRYTLGYQPIHHALALEEK